MEWGQANDVGEILNHLSGLSALSSLRTTAHTQHEDEVADRFLP